MDHDYIEKSDLVNQYLIDRLAADERAQFEEHLIDCPLCIDQLKMTRNFSRGLRLLTFQQTTQTESFSPTVSRWAFLQPASWKTLALTASCLLLAAILCTILLINHNDRLRFDVEQAKSDSSDWQRRYEEQQQAASLSEQHQNIEQDLRKQVRQLEAELQNDQNLRADKAGNAQGRIRPDINVPIFVFNSVRGNAQNPSSDINEVILPNSPVNFLISVPLDGEATYKVYRFSIFQGQRLIWRGSGFKPDKYNSLRIGLNSKYFRPGDHLLVVEGVAGSQGSRKVGNYPFRVVRSS